MLSTMHGTRGRSRTCDELMTRLLRQLALPAEFRIPPPKVRLSADGLASPDVSGHRSGPDSHSREPSPRAALSAEMDDHVLADLCTGLWRLRRRMVDPDTERPLEEMRKPFRHLESVWDTLAQAGVDIRDLTNEPVPEYGSIGLNVLAYQPMPGISRERVIETVKPSIYVGERLVQMGQVIIGTPEKPSGDAVEGEHT
jgi:hypothetical protein